jgi:hypothetical protein
MHGGLPATAPLFTTDANVDDDDVSRLSHLPAALFAMAFFAALPMWFLSTQQGPIHIECGGAPWRCEVARWVFFETRRGSYEVTAVSLDAQLRGGGRGRSYMEWRARFTLPSGTTVPAFGWVSTSPAAAVERLRQAAQTKSPVQADIEPDLGFWMAVGLTALFALIGFSLPMLSGGASPASVGRGRPDSA